MTASSYASTITGQSDLPTNGKLLLIGREWAKCPEIVETILGQLPAGTTHRIVQGFADYREQATGAEDLSLVIIVCEDDDVDEVVVLLRDFRLREPEPVVIVIPNGERSAELVACEVSVTLLQRMVTFDLLSQSSTWRMVRALQRQRQRFLEDRRLIRRLTEAHDLLDVKNARLEHFSAAVAHDIRGPLATICMRLDLVLEQLDSKVAPNIKDFLDASLRTGERLSEMVQGMYDFAKLGADIGTPEEISLDDLIDDIFGELRLREGAHLDLVRDELPAVWGYRTSLRRMWMNLLNNSVKYNESVKPSITVAVGDRIERNLGRFVSISLTDNGIGIEESDVPRLFHLGARGSDAHDFSFASKEGLGIGLAVVRRVIDQHLGTVSVSSTKGSGTTFKLSLPIEREVFALTCAP